MVNQRNAINPLTGDLSIQSIEEVEEAPRVFQFYCLDEECRQVAEVVVREINEVVECPNKS